MRRLGLSILSYWLNAYSKAVFTQLVSGFIIRKGIQGGVFEHTGITVTNTEAKRRQLSSWVSPVLIIGSSSDQPAAMSAVPRINNILTSIEPKIEA